MTFNHLRGFRPKTSGARSKPRREQPLRNLFGSQGESPVVRPLPVDVQEARPVAFVAEAQLLNHSQTGAILGPDVDLHTVQSERLEAMVCCHGHGRRRDPVTGPCLGERLGVTRLG